MEQDGAAEICGLVPSSIEVYDGYLCKGGYSPEKFRVLCNFIDVTKLPEVSSKTQIKDDYYVYLGRVNEVKGVRTLCKAQLSLIRN